MSLTSRNRGITFIYKLINHIANLAVSEGEQVKRWAAVLYSGYLLILGCGSRVLQERSRIPTGLWSSA